MVLCDAKTKQTQGDNAPQRLGHDSTQGKCTLKGDINFLRCIVRPRVQFVNVNGRGAGASLWFADGYGRSRIQPDRERRGRVEMALPHAHQQFAPRTADTLSVGSYSLLLLPLPSSYLH